MSTVQLVQALADDLSEALGFVRAYFGHDGLEFGSEVESAVAELVGQPSLGRFWFIEADGARIGYLVLTFGFDHEFGGRIGLVTDFYLSQSERGKGLGRLAMELALSEARSMGLRSIELYVLDHNDGARRLYQRLGFEDVHGRRPMTRKL